MISKITKLFKQHLLELGLIAILLLGVFTAWKGVLKQTIEGEGYYYFSPSISLINKEGKLADLVHGIDNFAKTSFYAQEKLFGSDIQNYMTVEVAIILLVSLSLFLLIWALTKNSTIAFLAAFYEGLYYTGNFQFFARGHLQWFYQRVPEVFPVFISIYFLHNYLKNKRVRNYVISFSFFVVAIFFDHYTTFFLPFFVSYILVSSVISKDDLKKKFTNALLLVPFVLVNYLITKNASLNLSVIHPNQTLLESFLMLKDVPQKMLFQLTVVSIPFSITQFIANFTKSTSQAVIQTLTIPTLLGHILILGNLYKTRSTHFKLILASLLGLFGVLFLTVYFNRVIVFNEIQEGRYYFVPGFYIGIIFAVFLKNIIGEHKSGKFFLLILVLFWFLTNNHYISKKVKDSQIYFDRNRAVYSYLDTNKDNFAAGSYILVQTSSNSFDFLNKYFSRNSTTFIYLDTNWRSKLPENVDPKKVYVIDTGQKSEIVDRTDEYRSLLKK